MANINLKLQVRQLKISELKPSEYNPRKWSDEQLQKLRESIKKYGVVDPLIVNNHETRKNIVVGGNMRLTALKEMGFDEVPIVHVSLDEKQERDLNIRLNKTGGDFDFDLLKEFDEELLAGIGFDSEELDRIFDVEDTTEKNSFDLKRIEEVRYQRNISSERRYLSARRLETDVWRLNDFRRLCPTYGRRQSRYVHD